VIYVEELTIPAQTTKEVCVRVPLPVVDGVISEVNVLFPDGCKGLVGVRIYDYEHIIYPSNPDHWLIADDEVIHWSDDYQMSGSPFELGLEGYNLDDSYEHTIYFRFVVIEASKASVMNKFTDWIKSW